MLDTMRTLHHLAQRAGVEFRWYQAEKAARVIRRASAALQRLNEQQCNGIPRYDATARMVLARWTDADEARAEMARDRHEARAVAALHSVIPGARVKFQRDPRGAPIQAYVTPDLDMQTQSAEGYF